MPAVKMHLSYNEILSLIDNNVSLGVVSTIGAGCGVTT